MTVTITRRPDGWYIDCDLCGWDTAYRIDLEYAARQRASAHSCMASHLAGHVHRVREELAHAIDRIDELSAVAIPEEDLEELQVWLQDPSRFMPNEAKRLHNQICKALGREPYWKLGQ